MASFPEVIPAGGRDEIKVVVKTKGYGGRNLHKRFVVHTNDRKKPKTTLVISGHVKAFVKMEPRYLRLIGKVGQSLEAEAKLWPLKEYPFTVTGVKPKKGKDIKAWFEPLEQKGRKGYLIKVKVLRREKGGFRDTILISTDSKEKPVLEMSVFGYLQQVKKGHVKPRPQPAQ